MPVIDPRAGWLTRYDTFTVQYVLGWAVRVDSKRYDTFSASVVSVAKWREYYVAILALFTSDLTILVMIWRSKVVGATRFSLAQ